MTDIAEATENKQESQVLQGGVPWGGQGEAHGVVQEEGKEEKRRKLEDYINVDIFYILICNFSSINETSK